MQEDVRIFISHSGKDRSAVEKVAGQVEAMGIGVYLAIHDPRPGQNLPDKIKRAIQASDALLVLVTSHSLGAPFVQQEVGFALGQEMPVIPLVASDVALSDTAMLQGVEVILFDPASPQEAFTDLTISLNRLAQQRSKEQRRERTEAMLALALIAVLLIMALSPSE